MDCAKRTGFLLAFAVFLEMAVNLKLQHK